MLLIYEDEAAEAVLSEEERQTSIARHIDLARRLRSENRLLAADPLQPAMTATCVRVADLDQALADAAAIPSAARGVIEVRPILDLQA
jgi:hypothetical protein